MNIDLINVLLPLPLEPQSKALFVKLPNAKFSVFSKRVFFCLSIPIIKSKLIVFILIIGSKLFLLVFQINALNLSS